MISNYKIAIIGLGYVGLPLAVEFSKKYSVIGFDINLNRIVDIKKGFDNTLEIDNRTLESVLVNNSKSKGLFVTSSIKDIVDANVFIITVPTPITDKNKPNFTPLLRASETVGKVLKHNDIVIYESTVYPGVTEDICVPVLEKESGLIFNKDFFAGYSPERINPGDKTHTVTQILKVTSGSTPDTAFKVDELYKSIIVAGTHLAPSIKVAEAAKVIENSQRDINIAFVNELSKIFRLLGLDTQDVLEAAGTKWNFLKFTPGLVGGHCIGVDPYYLAEKAIETGYNPEIILAGRRMNDSMGSYVAQETVKLMISNGAKVQESKVLVLGITFKENCPDIRNSRVIDIIKEFKSFSMKVDVHDPWAYSEAVKNEYGLDLLSSNEIFKNNYDAIVLAVAHKEFLKLDLSKLKSKHTIVFDVKNLFPKHLVDASL